MMQKADKKLKYSWLIISLWVIFPLHSKAQADTSDAVLRYEEYMEMVKTSHPLAMQASIQVLKGDAVIRESRGAFDPKLITEVLQKSFEETLYYDKFNGGIKIPTWFGMEVQSGYEQNQGVYLNPEENTPGAGLWYAGVSLPVGRGLFIDERRAALRQAKLYRKMAENDRELLMNELLYNAGNAYLDWCKSYYAVSVYEEALVLVQSRLDAVKRSAELGDRPFMDTLEVGIQFQNRQLLFQQASLHLDNARARLSVFLWEEGVVPLEITPIMTPPPIDSLYSLYRDLSDTILLDSLVAQHPKLERFSYKIEQLKVERNWKREQLKPSLDLKYNALSEPVNNDPFAAYTTSNYTWGISFNMPLFLRKERGSLKLTEFKLKEADLEIADQQAKILYHTRSTLNKWETLNQQITLFTRTVSDYRKLLNGELQLFETGESSVFMVNSRELGYINAQLKLIELSMELRKTGLAFDYAIGQLGTDG